MGLGTGPELVAGVGLVLLGVGLPLVITADPILRWGTVGIGVILLFAVALKSRQRSAESPRAMPPSVPTNPPAGPVPASIRAGDGGPGGRGGDMTIRAGDGGPGGPGGSIYITAGGGEPRRASGSIATPPSTEQLMLLDLRDLKRQQARASEILTLDLDDFAHRHGVTRELAQDTLSDLLASGKAEPYAATFGQPAEEGSVQITVLGMVSIR